MTKNHWTKSYHGITHYGKFGSKQYSATVEVNGDFIILRKRYPGCGFNPIEESFDSVDEAKEVGEAWVQSQGMNKPNPNTGETMKIIRVMFYDAHEGRVLSWFGNKKAANAWFKEQQKDRGEPPLGPEGVDEIEIPTSKEGLLKWLNDNFNRDNG